MKQLKLKVAKIIAAAVLQVQGAKARPDIGAVFAVAVKKVEEAIGLTQELRLGQVRARKEALLATERLQKALNELRDTYNRNVAAVVAHFGKYAEELRAIGVPPLTGSHRSPRKRGGASADGPSGGSGS